MTWQGKDAEEGDEGDEQVSDEGKAEEGDSVEGEATKSFGCIDKACLGCAEPGNQSNEAGNDVFVP